FLGAFSCTRLARSSGFVAGRRSRSRARLGAAAAFGAGNGLTDQLFNRDDGFLVERGDDGDCGAGAPRAAGAADAMDVVVGLMGPGGIEDVAGRGNVKPAGGNVGSDQQRNFALAEL